jgi:hypothetical protein
MRLNLGHSSALGVAAINRLAQAPAATGMSIDTAIEALTRELCRMDSDMAGHIQANFDDLSTLLDHSPCVLPDEAGRFPGATRRPSAMGERADCPQAH